MAFDPEAVYNQTVADIGLQEGWEEGALGEQDANLKTNTAAQEGDITRVEPGTYRSESNASNRGGILTSGTNAHRKEGIASGFAARRAANQRALLEGENSIKRQREGGKLKRTERLHGAEQTRAAERDRIAREEAANAPTPPAAPAPPAFTNPGYGPQYQTYPTLGTYGHPAPALRVVGSKPQRNSRSR